MRNAAQISLCLRIADKNFAGIIVATGTYVAHVPEALRRVADEAGFPIIEPTWEIPFEDVVRVVWEHSINDQYLRTKQSIAIHPALPSSIANMSTRWRRSRSCPRSVDISK